MDHARPRKTATEDVGGKVAVSLGAYGHGRCLGRGDGRGDLPSLGPEPGAASPGGASGGRACEGGAGFRRRCLPERVGLPERRP